MAVFVYTGRTRGGQTITGEMDAPTREAVVAKLRTQQIVATNVRGKPKDITIPGFGGGVDEKEIVVFTRQFATMIDAGLPLVQCLEILGSQQDNRLFQKIILAVRQDGEAVDPGLACVVRPEHGPHEPGPVEGPEVEDLSGAQLPRDVSSAVATAD